MAVLSSPWLTLRQGFVVLRLVLPALRRTPFLAVALVASALLATTVLAAAPTFTDAIATAGIQRELSRTSPLQKQVLLQGRLYDVSAAGRDAVFADANPRLQSELGWLLQPPIFESDAAAGRVALVAGEAPVFGSPAGIFQYFHGLPEHVDVIAGALPSGATDDGLIHVAVGAFAAETLDLSVGQEISFLPPERAGSGLHRVVIDAIVTQRDPAALLWQGSTRWFRAGSEGNSPPILRFFVNEETYFGQIAAAMPLLQVTYSWIYPTNAPALNAGSTNAVREALVALRSEVSAAVPRTSVLSAVDLVIQRYEEKRLFSGLPVIALLLQVAALVLFLVWILGQSLASRLAWTFALLRSRGASRTQVFVGQSLLGLLIAVPAAIVAPFIAVAAVRALGWMPLFEASTGGSSLPADFGWPALLAALLGALACALCIALPALAAVRSSGVTAQREAARPATVPFVHRYYVDLLVLAAGLILFWELHEGQSAVSRSIFGDRNVDPILLFAPGFLAAGIGLVLLRIIPVVSTIMSKLLSPIAGAGLALVLMRFSRSPGIYTRIALLAMMVATLGSLSATFGSTVVRSHEERAEFAVGADLRLSSVSGAKTTDGSDLVAAAAPAADGASLIPMQRTGVGIPFGSSTLPVQMLAVDSDVAREIFSLRPDFLSVPPAQFWNAVRGNRSLDPGRRFPGEPRFVRIFLKVDPPQDGANAWLRLSDESGRYYNVLLGALSAAEWTPYEADLEEAIQNFDEVVFPLRLQAVFFSNLGQLTTASGGTVWLDAVQSRAAATAEWETVEDFEGQAQFQLLLTNTVTPDALDSSSEDQADGTRSARFRWVATQSASSRYVVFSNFNAPVPAAFSESLLAQLGVRVGDLVVVSLGLDTIPLRVVTSHRLFPTLDPSDGGSIVVELRHLSTIARLVDSRERTRPNELWLLGDGIDRDAVVAALRESDIRVARFEDLDDAKDSIAGDPLLAAGAGGLFLIGLGAALLVAVIGVTASVAELVDRRRIEGAVLRAIGLSEGTLSRSWWFETTLMILAGAAAGIALGRLLGETMLGFLAFDERGRDTVPPFQVTTDTAVFVALLLLLAAALAGIAVAFAVAARRLQVPSELRVVD